MSGCHASTILVGGHVSCAEKADILHGIRGTIASEPQQVEKTASGRMRDSVMGEPSGKTYDMRPPREILLDRGALVVTLVLYVLLPALVVGAVAALIVGGVAFLVVGLMAVVISGVVWRLKTFVRDDGRHMREQGLVRLEELPEKCGLCGANLADRWSAVPCEDCGLWYPPAEDDLCDACRNQIAAEVQQDLGTP